MEGNGQKWVYPPTFQTNGGAPRCRDRLSPVFIPNHSKFNTDAKTKRPRQCKARASTFANLRPRRRTNRAAGKKGPTRYPFSSDNHVGIPTICNYLYLSPLFVHFFGLLRPLLSEVYPLLTTLRPSKFTLHVTARQNIQDVRSPHRLFSRPAELCRKQTAHK